MDFCYSVHWLWRCSRSYIPQKERRLLLSYHSSLDELSNGAETIWTQAGNVTQSLTNFTAHFRDVFGIPAGDSSTGDQLYRLQQGSMSIADYTLRFRTLAAASGWNERSLLTTFRQGLEPNLRLHLAAYDDSIGLEQFIQLASRVSNRLHSCEEGHLSFKNPYPSLRRPENVSPPEPIPEPMQIETTRLSLSERQRRLKQGLCLYCGASGHVISACPVRPPRLLVSSLCPSPASSKPLTTMPLLRPVMYLFQSLPYSTPARQGTLSPVPSAASSTFQPRPPRPYTK